MRSVNYDARTGDEILFLGLVWKVTATWPHGVEIHSGDQTAMLRYGTLEAGKATYRHTWTHGDVLTYHGRSSVRGATEAVVRGLFWYSGLGMGHLYRPDGTVAWMTTSEAQVQCEEDRICMIFKDSMEGLR